MQHLGGDLISPMVILYNLACVGLVGLWATRDKHQIENWVRQADHRIWWGVFLLTLLISLSANLTFLTTDVEDAIISACKAFVNDGSNPYQDLVVVHHLNDQDVLGLYHYFPTDLLVYSLFYVTFGKMLDPLAFEVGVPDQMMFELTFEGTWFLIANSIFLGLSYIITRKVLPEIPDKRLLPIFGFVVSFFLFTNSALMVLYFVLGLYCFLNLKHQLRHDAGVVSYIASAGVKYVTGLFLVVQFVEETLAVRKIGDLRFLRPYLVGGAFFLLTILPFGALEVLEATFIYQGAVEERSSIAGVYGPLLVEVALVLGLFEYYTIIFLIASVVTFGIAFYVGKNTYERQMWWTFLLFFVLPFYATEMFVIPVLLWLFAIFGKEFNFPSSSYWFTDELREGENFSTTATEA